MPTDDHPIIKQARDYAPELPDRSAVYEAAALHSALMPQDHRTALLQHVQQQLLADEGSLRERAQLLSLHRRLSDADNKLRAAKR